MKRSLLLLSLLLLASLTAMAQLKGKATTQDLRDLVAPGKRVYVLFDDKTDDIDEKEEYIVEYLREDDRWMVTDKKEEADFILYVEGYSKRVRRNSLTSKTYYMTPTIRRKDGTDVWTGETVYDWAHLGNGLRAVQGVSWRLVRALWLGLEKELGEDRVLLSI